MTRTKVLTIAAAIILLGALQLANFRNSTGRARGVGTASGMVALLSGIGVGIYGLTIRSQS
jgi:hypothetical protein